MQMMLMASAESGRCERSHDEARLVIHPEPDLARAQSRPRRGPEIEAAVKEEALRRSGRCDQES